MKMDPLSEEVGAAADLFFESFNIIDQRMPKGSSVEDTIKVMEQVNKVASRCEAQRKEERDMRLGFWKRTFRMTLFGGRRAGKTSTQLFTASTPGSFSATLGGNLDKINISMGGGGAVDSIAGQTVVTLTDINMDNVHARVCSTSLYQMLNVPLMPKQQPLRTTTGLRQGVDAVSPISITLLTQTSLFQQHSRQPLTPRPTSSSGRSPSGSNAYIFAERARK